MHAEGLYNLYALPNITSLTGSAVMIWATHVTCPSSEKHTKFYTWDLKGRDQLQA